MAFINYQPGISAIEINSDFFYNVRIGNVVDTRIETVTFFNMEIGALEEDLWNVGGTRTVPTSAQKMSLVSSSANDTVAGTGARFVTLQGLNATFDEIEEIVAMNGTTPVLTTLDFIRLNVAIVNSVGSAGSNVGNITITANTDATIQGRIDAGLGKTFNSQYTIPATKAGYVFSIAASMSETDAMRIKLVGKLGTNVPTITFGNFIVRQKMNEEIPFGFVPGASDIKLTGTRVSGVLNFECTGAYYMLIAPAPPITP